MDAVYLGIFVFKMLQCIRLRQRKIAIASGLVCLLAIGGMAFTIVTPSAYNFIVLTYPADFPWILLCGGLLVLVVMLIMRECYLLLKKGRSLLKEDV